MIKLIKKRHKNTWRSGIRILSMNKDELHVKPIPSYILMGGFEWCVTYLGQQITCKYYGEPGNVQSRCKKAFVELSRVNAKI